MGRVKGKGKKHTVLTDYNDIGKAKEDKIRASKRWGRPQKPLKDEVGDEESEKIVNGDENDKSSVEIKSSLGQITTEDGMKRKRSLQMKEYPDYVEEENSLQAKSIANDSVKTVGFRQNGSRRKSKPRRAAEVGVET